jgi:4-amino-4-deoxy-L-arabinose transferase-like glycosyltransferase
MDERAPKRWTADRIALAILAVLVLAGVALRVVAALSWWPIATNLGDSWPYATHALHDPFDDPMHPAGYSLALAVIGFFTRDVGVVSVLQNLMGIASALILFAGVRRLCGSPWPGLLGAAVILLGADQVFLERTIMSETFFTLLLSATIYATARALESPERWYPWPLAAAALGLAMGITRSAGLVLLPLIALALLLAAPRPWLARWRPVAAFSALVVVGLLAFASANDISHDRFEIAPTPGWHLYSRAATVADCSEFQPPEGTQALCEQTGREERLGMDWYLYYPRSPATRLFGNITEAEGAGDAQLGAWARRAILADPRAYLEVVWPDLEAYYFPEGYEYKFGKGVSLDDQLDWSAEWNARGVRTTAKGMEEFFDPFSIERDAGLLGFLHDYQRVFRFGGTALTIATLLTLLGLCLGRRRERIALMLLGVGSVAMILIPTFSVNYSGRYTVPPAGLLAAAAAIAAMAIWRRFRPTATADS